MYQKKFSHSIRKVIKIKETNHAPPTDYKHCKKKFNTEFLHRWMYDLRSKQNKAINALQICWKPLQGSFQKIFLIGGKIF